MFWKPPDCKGGGANALTSFFGLKYNLNKKFVFKTFSLYVLL